MSFDVDTPKEDPEVTRQREEAEARAETSRADENEEAARVGTNKLMRRFGLSRRARGATPKTGQYVPPSYFGFLPQSVQQSLFGGGQPYSSTAPAFLAPRQATKRSGSLATVSGSETQRY